MYGNGKIQYGGWSTNGKCLNLMENSGRGKDTAMENVWIHWKIPVGGRLWQRKNPSRNKMHNGKLRCIGKIQYGECTFSVPLSELSSVAGTL